MNIFSRAFHAVTHAISGAAHAVVKTVEKVGLPIVALAATAATIAGVPGASIVKNIVDKVETAASKVKDVITNIAGAVGGPITDALNAVNGVIHPIADVVDSIAQQVRDINEHVIQPIVGPIQAAITESHTVLAALQADLHGGISGLLRIPQTISDALTSVDASLARAMSQLGAGNSELVTKILGPAIHDAGAVPLGAVTAAIHGINAAPEPAHPYLKSIHIDEPGNLGAIQEEIAHIYEKVQTEGGMFATLLRGALDIMSTLGALEAALEPRSEYYKSESFKSLPTKPLDPATVIAAMLRGVTSPDSGAEELARNGLDQSRRNILEEMSHPLPGVGDLTTMLDRGEVTHDDYLDIMHRLGWDKDDAQRLWRIAHTVPGVSESITYWHRLQAAGEGIASGTLGQLPPASVIDAAQRAGADLDVLAAAWLGHWQLLPAATWVDAYYRRLVTFDQLRGALHAVAIPHELHQLLIDVTRPLIQFRAIPGLVASGIWDKSKGADALKQHGYTDSDAEALLEYALRKAKGTKTATAPALHDLSIQEAISAYESGMLSHDETLQLLKDHKLDDRAATIMLKLADVKAERTRRASGVADVIAEVESGLLTMDDAIAALHQLGLSTGEVSKAVARIQRAKRQMTKLPGVGEVEKMYKKAIITQQVASDTMSLLGYQPEWVDRFLQLWGAEPAASPLHAVA